MDLQYADTKDLKNGWILSYSLLLSIENWIKDNCEKVESPSLEEIEAVLIAFKTTSNE